MTEAVFSLTRARFLFSRAATTACQARSRLRRLFVLRVRSLALIPKLIRQAVFIAEEVNEKDKNEYDSFRYYVVGLNMEGVDYTVKLAIGVKNGFTYYDHALSPIEKTKLLRSIDEIKRPFASKESTDDGEQVSNVLSICKDKRLISILQAK
ncbi:MAG: hypothetical protein IJ144_03945 [Prevotella sp.]|nr:hypothetical protein [Prevotella sp.]